MLHECSQVKNREQYLTKLQQSEWMGPYSLSGDKYMILTINSRTEEFYGLCLIMSKYEIEIKQVDFRTKKGKMYSSACIGYAQRFTCE
jgi:hypothetical protein